MPESSDETRIPLSDDRTASPTATAADASTVFPASGPSGEPAGHALPLGTRLAEFEVTGVIGEGGFGIVYAAHDHSLDRDVAVKEYMPAALATRTHGVTVSVRSARHQETFELGLKSFVNEARLLARFDHPSLVKVHRFWEAHGTAYMAMPHYRGITLKNRMQDATAPDEAWLRRLLVSLLEALDVIHRENVFHRDIAPDNIMLLEQDVPVLLDFGAARRVIGDATQGLTVILKPGYAPIEQYAEVKSMKQGAWTDLYALAATVHFVITGKAPQPAVARMVEDQLTPLAQSARGCYSEGLLAALDAALRVKPEERPQNVAAFRALLDAAPDRMGARRIAFGRETRSSRVPVVAAAVLLAALGAGGYAYLNRDAATPAQDAPAQPAAVAGEPKVAAVPPVPQPAPPAVSQSPPTASEAADPTQAAPSPAATPVPAPVQEAVAPSPPAQKPPPKAATKPAADERQVARVEPKPPAPKQAATPPPDVGQEAYRQPEAPRDNVQVTAWLAQAQQSLARREFRRAMGLAENALALDPSNTQARDIRRRAQEGEKRAFEEIKIE